MLSNPVVTLLLNLFKEKLMRTPTLWGEKPFANSSEMTLVGIEIAVPHIPTCKLLSF